MAGAFDLAIIGGGINGAALAELAVHNGYDTVLLERRDFGAGVTSRSTRLIHGGLRYLEHGHVGLVRESLREREALGHQQQLALGRITQRALECQFECE